MKKLFLTLGAVLAFGIVSAQTETTKSKAVKTRTQTDRTSKKMQSQTDIRTNEQQKSAAENNINSLERNNNTISTPPASAPGIVNPNSSAMPQMTPPVTTPPPGAPMTTEPVGNPVTPANP